IHVESVLDQGTTFTVELPFGLSPEKVEPDFNKIHKIRALVVDDDSDTCEHTSIVLSRIGVEHDCTTSGEQAMKLIAQACKEGHGYDICFLDWQMPCMDGIELTKQIRKAYTQDTLIIIISAYDLNEIEEQAKAAGANMFIPKPLFQSTVFNVLMGLSNGGYTKITAEAKDYDFTGRRILLAEDNELNMEIAVELLSMVGVTVDQAVDGQEVCDKFQSSAPGTYDIILMDIQMPVMNGYEATKVIRTSSHEDAGEIPILAMTANAFTEDVSAALSAGMNGHIAKPIDTEILYRTLQNFFK
ncbi:MAG: response regulator, partial [Hungatella sp.]